jgi:1,4-dihydroxy-2-naphthoate octaprenyltransferase
VICLSFESGDLEFIEFKNGWLNELKNMRQTPSQNTNTIRSWILASRPKTLPAALAPVAVGSAMAYAHQGFVPAAAIASLFVAVLLQIAVNLANDYFDFVKGVDGDDRLGPVRVTQSGLIPARQVKSAMIVTLIAAALPGLYLIFVGGWPVVFIGIACMLAVLAYSGGPRPLASHGLGDVFVFIFFGIVAVCGTYYVQALQITPMVICMGTMVGLMITAVLVVNNLRDIQTDQRAGKRTLAVILGARATKLEYTLLHAGAYMFPIVLWLFDLGSGWVLLPELTMPFAIDLNRKVWKDSAEASLNQTLAATAKLALIFSLLLSIGLLL